MKNATPFPSFIKILPSITDHLIILQIFLSGFVHQIGSPDYIILYFLILILLLFNTPLSEKLKLNKKYISVFYLIFF